MWAQVLARRSRMTHSKKATNKMSHSRAKVTKVEMMELMNKKKNRSKPFQTPIAQISTSLLKQRM